ncbi:hypothetical protein AQZ52_17750 [Novosphingobium fuchskuhlense]|uniref:Uncharacterized protein n=1 Tax=Novosphingobium fuchskuhlense TaxID=1117702 RepID=A0A117USB3_9SPHN|nr:hypothetical protein AQZ52_17750 [Novosphingobium fuchskuhlense]
MQFAYSVTRRSTSASRWYFGSGLGQITAQALFGPLPQSPSGLEIGNEPRVACGQSAEPAWRHMAARQIGLDLLQ